MKIDVRNERGVTILVPKGKINIGVGDVALREAVHEALEAGSRKLVIDFGSVSTIDSSGIGEVVNAHTTVVRRDGKLVLANLPSKVADILQITQLVEVFEIYESASEAVDQFERE